ncbi:MAG: hypothetical protein ACUVTD_07100 [Nitrososphaerales archaeon]
MEYELILKSKGYSDHQIREDLTAFRNMPNLGEAPLTVNVILKASELMGKIWFNIFRLYMEPKPSYLMEK